jgi:hypothetical protein
MKGRRLVVDGISIFYEENISEAQLLHLPLLCFWNSCVFARANRPEVGGSCEFAHSLANFCGVGGKDEAEYADWKGFLLIFFWIVLLV